MKAQIKVYLQKIHRAFENCTGLTTLEYLGSVSEWENITKGIYIFSGAKLNGEDVTTIKCSDGNANI